MASYSRRSDQREEQPSPKNAISSTVSGDRKQVSEVSVSSSANPVLDGASSSSATSPASEIPRLELPSPETEISDTAQVSEVYASSSANPFGEGGLSSSVTSPAPDFLRLDQSSPEIAMSDTVSGCKKQVSANPFGEGGLSSSVTSPAPEFLRLDQSSSEIAMSDTVSGCEKQVSVSSSANPFGEGGLSSSVTSPAPEFLRLDQSSTEIAMSDTVSGCKKQVSVSSSANPFGEGGLSSSVTSPAPEFLRLDQSSPEIAMSDTVSGCKKQVSVSSSATPIWEDASSSSVTSPAPEISRFAVGNRGGTGFSPHGSGSAGGSCSVVVNYTISGGEKQDAEVAATSSSPKFTYSEMVALGKSVPANKPEVSSCRKPIKKPMKRPTKLGKHGHPIKVKANHFNVTFKIDTPLYSYKVEAPSYIITLVGRSLIGKLLNEHNYVYNGQRTLYTTKPLPVESGQPEVLFEGVNVDGFPREFNVDIRQSSSVSSLSLSIKHAKETPIDLVQALHLVLKEPLRNGIDGQNHFQSLRMTQKGLSLNVDVLEDAFCKPVLVTEQLIQNWSIDLNKSLSPSDLEKLAGLLLNATVYLKHFCFKRNAKIRGITSHAIKDISFSLKDKETTLMDYYSTKYGYRLRYPSLPAATDSRSNYYPIELCGTIIKPMKVLDTPQERETKIKKVVQAMKFQENHLVNKIFKMVVSEDLTEIVARQLTPPKLTYHDNQETQPINGTWSMKDKKFYEGADVQSWTCVNFSETVTMETAKDFCKMLIEMCITLGTKMNVKPAVELTGHKPAIIKQALKDIHDKKLDLQLLIVILPDARGSYGMIKTICETGLGIVSQCCRPSKVTKQINLSEPCRQSDGYLESLAFKINVKTGGRNQVLSKAIGKQIRLVSVEPTIIMGADVNHPGPGDHSSPSIAAIVASTDWPEIASYRALISSQPHRQEIMTEEQASVLIKEHLKFFYKRNRQTKPRRIIFFRDGVGERDFETVLSREVRAILKACEELEVGYEPKITFVVVQKRHHTRLFRATTCQNIPAGTVVDTEICEKSGFDFYLKSHMNNKGGTSTPAHYHVLVDDNNFTADELQTLINDLCYTCPRFTRSVPIVPPAHYAHLAAFRGHYYYMSRNTVETTAIQPLPEIISNVRNVMFYC